MHPELALLTTGDKGAVFLDVVTTLCTPKKAQLRKIEPLEYYWIPRHSLHIHWICNPIQLDDC